MTQFHNPPALSPVRQTLGLLAWLALSFLTAYIGAVASITAPTFYGQLVQPAWAPPAWLFGPVWTTLFIMMGIAAWLVWRRGGFGAQRAPLLLFLAQLVFNGLWSWLFFAWHLGGWALADIAILWLLIAATIAAFRRTSPVAALLLVPYIAWVSFAGALNYTLWQLNPQILGG
ncbi:MAG TPA: TspO/MBR family protein [Wenzhouxiangellaceae bacterium]|nr:TspO/MBR family protein [Wenzhouxiangellaceae bacterium]